MTRLKEKKPVILPPMAKRAMAYLDESKKTMYGYTPGDPLRNLLSSVPKKERQYLQGIINAPPEERERVRDRLSPYMKRIVQQAWKEPVEEPKPDLMAYFKEHFMPDPEWGGWKENASLQDVKVKYIKAESMDPSEFDVWPEDESASRRPGVPPAPRMDVKEKVERVRDQLSILLGRAGLEADVQVEHNNSGVITVDTQHSQDIRSQIDDYVNNYGSLVLN
jgi:hypothetical protein